ncbi:7931_t:CDS:2, partial [Funneliformis caledonium]
MKPHLKLVQGPLEEQELQDDNSKTRLEIATLLTQQKHPPEATSFCKNVDLEEQLKTKEDIFDKKSQFEALDVLCVSRSQKASKYINKVGSRLQIQAEVAREKNIDTNSQEFKRAVENLIHHHDISTLCLYLQSKLKEWITAYLAEIAGYSAEAVPTYLEQLGPLDYQQQQMFLNLLADKEETFTMTENWSRNDRVLIKTCYFAKDNDTMEVDSLAEKVETTASPPKDITMNVDSPSDVSENILDNTSVPANNVESMPESDVRQLKCGNGGQFDKGKTMEQIFNDGCEQLLRWVQENYHGCSEFSDQFESGQYSGLLSLFVTPDNNLKTRIVAQAI